MTENNDMNERSTEEIRVISEGLNENGSNSLKWKRYRVPVLILAVSFLLLVTAISAKYIFGSGFFDDDGYLNKDTALRSAWEAGKLRFIYEGKTLSVENADSVFTLINSGDWTFAPQLTSEETTPLCTMLIDDGYTIEFYKSYAAVCRNGKSRFYSFPQSITSGLCGYLEDNTYISLDDMVSLISVSDSLTLEIGGFTCETAKGQSIANAMNVSTWTEISDKTLNEDPFITVTAPVGLTVTIYEVSKKASVSYKGNVRFYETDSLVPASVALAAQSFFNAESEKISDAMNSCGELIIVVDGTSYRISSNTSWLSALDFSSWTRRYKVPAAIPDSATVTVFDDISFTLKIYGDLSVAEYENSYYNIPDTVVSAVRSYLSAAASGDIDTEIKSFTVSELSAEILKNQYLKAEFSGSSSLTTVGNDLISALALNSWTEATGESQFSTDIRLVSDKNASDGGYFVIRINSEHGTAEVVWKNITKRYSIPSAATASTLKYIQNNAYAELWTISATELGTLQNAATSVDAVITGAASDKEYLFSNVIGVSDVIKLAASLNLTPLESKPDAGSQEKTEMTFKSNSGSFLMTFYPDADGHTTVSVSGTLGDIGKRIDRYFSAGTNEYKSFIAEVRSLIVKTYDVTAGLFVESIKSGDMTAFNRIAGSTYDYSAIKNVKFNSISSEKTSVTGKYLIKLDVADSTSGPFPEGESTYVLILGASDTASGLKIKTFAEQGEYTASVKSHAAITEALDFASWYVADDPYFTSLSDVSSKKSAADYLMLLALREGLNTVSPDDSSVMLFSQEVINKMALKYFNVEAFDARDTTAYDTEKGLYVYTSKAVPVDYKRVVKFLDNNAGNRYTVVITWFDDPLYLYAKKTAVYVLDKSSSGVYRILSSSASISAEPTAEKEPDSDNEQTQEPEKEEEKPSENAE